MQKGLSAISIPSVSSAWKGVDDTLKLLEKMANILKPLHRDAEVAGLARQLRLRRQQPLYVFHSDAADASVDLEEVELPGAAGPVMAHRVRPGVLLLDDRSGLGLRRHFCDVSLRDTAALMTEHRATTPLLCDTLPDSDADGVLAAFGAARQAWFSLDELQLIVSRELEALDRLIEKLKVSTTSPTDPDEDSNYLARLGMLVADLLQEERDRSRDREAAQRNFQLIVHQVVEHIGTDAFTQEIKSSAIDHFRPRWLRHVFGKTSVEVRLNNEAINRLVETIDQAARRAADERIRGIARRINKLEAGRFSRRFGQDAEHWLQPSASRSRSSQTTHEAIATAGRGFRFKFERLGIVNRLMRARMEIAGLFMLVFLGLSVFTEQATAMRKPITLGALVLALIITVVSYFTSRALEEERLQEEMESLREQLSKAGMEAAARCYGDVLEDTMSRIEEIANEIKSSLGAQSGGRAGRTVSAPSVIAILSSLKTELSRELSNPTGGSTYIKQQLEQLIGPGGSLRTALR